MGKYRRNIKTVKFADSNASDPKKCVMSLKKAKIDSYVKGLSQNCIISKIDAFMETFGEPEINYKLSKQLEDNGNFST